MLVIVGTRTDEHFFRSRVEIAIFVIIINWLANLFHVVVLKVTALYNV